MIFEEALVLLKQGRSVRRQCWSVDQHIGLSNRDLYIGMIDMLAIDWEVVREGVDFDDMPVGQEFISPNGDRCLKIVTSRAKGADLGAIFNAIRLCDCWAHYIGTNYRCELA